MLRCRSFPVFVVLMGIFSPPAAFSAETGNDDKSIGDAYKWLLTTFAEDRQGFGLDRHGMATEDQPMSYGLILSAEALRAASDKTKKESPEYAESPRRAKKAVRWLIDNRDLDGDGKPGWGLPQSWDAWGDGSENPPNQPYTITTAIVLTGLFDALAVPELFDENERKEITDVVRAVVLRWCCEVWSEGYGGGYFWYSPGKQDDVFGINAPAMFLACLVRLLEEQDDSLSPAERDLVRSRADALAKAAASTVELRDGEPLWRYAPLPNSMNNNRPNDLVHHVYILLGIETYRDWNEAGIKIPCTREKAIASVDRFLADADPASGRPRRILEYSPFDDPQSDQARLWGAGFMLAFYAKWADDARIERTFRLIEENYGPFPRLRWIGPDAKCADKKACYPRHTAHVLYGMAIAAFE